MRKQWGWQALYENDAADDMTKADVDDLVNGNEECDSENETGEDKVDENVDDNSDVSVDNEGDNNELSVWCRAGRMKLFSYLAVISWWSLMVILKSVSRQ